MLKRTLAYLCHLLVTDSPDTSSNTDTNNSIYNRSAMDFIIFYDHKLLAGYLSEVYSGKSEIIRYYNNLYAQLSIRK